MHSGDKLDDQIDSIVSDKYYRAAIRIGLSTNPYQVDYKQKTPEQRVIDNIYWLQKFGEVNYFYYCYQLDRNDIDVRNAKNCMPARKFYRLRDRSNFRNDQTRKEAKIIADKLLFEQFISAKKIPTPRTIAFISNGWVEWFHSKRQPCSIDQFFEYDVAAFCKPTEGMQGKGAFSLRITKGEPYVNDKSVKRAYLKKLLSGQYLAQEAVTQHEALAMLHPASVNTIRIVTTRSSSKEVVPLTACLRIGAGGRKVDNWASGGIIVNIDMDTGCLSGPGFFKPGKGGRVTVHPDTNIELNGYRIPYFADAVQICRQAHDTFQFHSVGWDVGVLPHGPTIIEANGKWDGAIPMTLDPEFAARFLASVPPSTVGPTSKVNAQP